MAVEEIPGTISVCESEKERVFFFFKKKTALAPIKLALTFSEYESKREQALNGFSVYQLNFPGFLFRTVLFRTAVINFCLLAVFTGVLKINGDLLCAFKILAFFTLFLMCFFKSLLHYKLR